MRAYGGALSDVGSYGPTNILGLGSSTGHLERCEYLVWLKEKKGKKKNLMINYDRLLRLVVHKNLSEATYLRSSYNAKVRASDWSSLVRFLPGILKIFAAASSTASKKLSLHPFPNLTCVTTPVLISSPNTLKIMFFISSGGRGLKKHIKMPERIGEYDVKSVFSIMHQDVGK